MSNDEFPRDAELSALYREAADAMPPLALDRRILTAAQSAIKHTEPVMPRRRPWWLRFAAPMGAFATLVLTVTVVMLVEHEQKDLLPRGDEAPAAASAPVQNVEPELKKEQAAAGAQPQRSALPAAKSAAAPVVTAPAAASVAPPPLERRSAGGVAADAVTSRDEAKEAAMPPAASAPQAQPAESSGEQLSSRPTAAAPTPMLERAAPMSKSLRGSASSSNNSSVDQAPRSPESWLAEIRRLRAAGREADAREQLERFRKAYPDFVLPADLR